jgi:hypothetical protein
MDEFPAKMPYKVHISKKWKVQTRRDGWKNDNDAWSILYRKIANTIRGSVGQDWNDIYSKLSDMVRHVPFDFILDKYTWEVEFAYWNSRKQDWFFRDRFGRTVSTPASEVIADYRKQYRWRNGFYWVDPETNILCHIPSKQGKNLSKQEVRKYAEKKKERKRQNRISEKERKKRGLPQLAMINKPELFQFYNSLTKKKLNLLDTIHKTPEKFPEIEYTETVYVRIGGAGRCWRNRWTKPVTQKIQNPIHRYNRKVKNWKMQERGRVYKANTAKKELAPIQEQIDNLEQGNYNVFFESNAYLYSLQKECHHFGTSHKA